MINIITTLILFHLLSLISRCTCCDIALSVLVSFQISNQLTEKHFILCYHDLSIWQDRVKEFCKEYDLNHIELLGIVEARLKLLQYDIVNTNITSSASNITSYDASQILLKSVRNHSSQQLFLKFLSHAIPQASPTPTMKPRYIDFFRYHYGYDEVINLTSRIILYQASTGPTGGTKAIHILYKTILKLGYPIILCDLLTPNDLPSTCVHPSVNDVVILGEWCHAIADFNLTTPLPFLGRGVQYHLGFHHSRDICP